MALVDLLNVRKFFGADLDEPDSETYRELLVMVLARATDVDAYTHPAEVETVQQVLRESIGVEISSADVRIAAKSALFESAPLEKYVTRIGLKLPMSKRMELVGALANVMRADEQVASSEASYFNTICEALELSFADVAGLTSH